MDDELQRPLVSTTFSRRRLFGGLAATTVMPALLAACGDGDTPDAVESPASPDATDSTGLPASPELSDSDEYTLVTRFPGSVLTPGEVRMPYQLSLGAANIISNGPDTLGAQLADIDGQPIGDKFSASKRQVDPFPYYDFRVQIDEPGIYTLFVDDGPETGASIQIVPAEASPVPSAGMALPPFDTPTFADEQGFEAICSRKPEPCPFHEISLTEALATGKPVAYYVGTPAFCSTGSCGPALEALITAADKYGDQIEFVHAEVYSDNAGTMVTDAVGAVGMFYEPALFVTDATGVIIERLDAIWGPDELDEVLSRAVA